MGRSLGARRSIAAALAVLSWPAAATTCRSRMGDGGPVDAVEYIRRAVETVPIVMLAEGGHSAREPHRFLRRVLSDPGVLAAVDVIVVEFAAGAHQGVLDAYIRGEDVPFDTLSRIWRDTQQSPVGPWDSPLYQTLLEVIRDANVRLAPERRVRVLAGDPPIDWERIRTRDDYLAASTPRDPYVAALATEQAFRHGRHVLVVFGGVHLPKATIAPGDPRNSITSRILANHPGAVRAIEFLKPEDLGIGDRIGELREGTAYPTERHWIGDVDAGLLFPMVYAPVTNPGTGQQEMQEVRLYAGRPVRDLFDALVYIGPSHSWEIVQPAFDQGRDAAYLAELNRRSILRFGRPFDSGGEAP